MTDILVQVPSVCDNFILDCFNFWANVQVFCFEILSVVRDGCNSRSTRAAADHVPWMGAGSCRWICCCSHNVGAECSQILEMSIDKWQVRGMWCGGGQQALVVDSFAISIKKSEAPQMATTAAADPQVCSSRSSR